MTRSKGHRALLMQRGPAADSTHTGQSPETQDKGRAQPQVVYSELAGQPVFWPGHLCEPAQGRPKSHHGLPGAPRRGPLSSQ